MNIASLPKANLIVTWSGQTLALWRYDEESRAEAEALADRIRALAERHGLEGERVEIACSTRKVNARGEARSIVVSLLVRGAELVEATTIPNNGV